MRYTTYIVCLNSTSLSPYIRMFNYAILNKTQGWSKRRGEIDDALGFCHFTYHSSRSLKAKVQGPPIFQHSHRTSYLKLFDPVLVYQH